MIIGLICVVNVQGNDWNITENTTLTTGISFSTVSTNNIINDDYFLVSDISSLSLIYFNRSNSSLHKKSSISPDMEDVTINKQFAVSKVDDTHYLISYPKQNMFYTELYKAIVVVNLTTETISISNIGGTGEMISGNYFTNLKFIKITNGTHILGYNDDNDYNKIVKMSVNPTTYGISDSSSYTVTSTSSTFIGGYNINNTHAYLSYVKTSDNDNSYSRVVTVSSMALSTENNNLPFTNTFEKNSDDYVIYFSKILDGSYNYVSLNASVFYLNNSDWSINIIDEVDLNYTTPTFFNSIGHMVDDSYWVNILTNETSNNTYLQIINIDNNNTITKDIFYNIKQTNSQGFLSYINNIGFFPYDSVTDGILALNVFETSTSDTCTCPGLNNNWEIDLSDHCDITTSCNLGTGALTFTGSGYTTINAEVNTTDLGDVGNGNFLYIKSLCRLFIS